MPGSATVTSFGRVISVRGSLARVGLLATSQTPLSEIRATVGKFVSIRCASSTIVAMITDASCEDIPTSDNYIASAGVDLLGEISGGEKPKFQRGVTNYPTIGDAVELISNQELRTVYAPSGSDQIDVGTLQQDRLAAIEQIEGGCDPRNTAASDQDVVPLRLHEFPHCMPRRIGPAREYHAFDALWIGAESIANRKACKRSRCGDQGLRPFQGKVNEALRT